MQNPLTPQQQQQQLQQVLQEPIVEQPTPRNAPAIIPHLQSIYGECFLFVFHSHLPNVFERWRVGCSMPAKQIKDFAHFGGKIRNPINLLSNLIEFFFLSRSIFLSSDKHNGDHPRLKKHSTTESLYSRHEHSKKPKKETTGMEGSWIYALCMRCRVQCEYLRRSK